ncbi:hypothetical protein [Echinicola shivajiensis]|nr:hypothetical protein [Echinicola shivajiensis]
MKVSIASVSILQSSDHLSKGFMVTGIIADNQINFFFIDPVLK